MTISDLNEMEARVDIGEMDVVRIAPGQKARLEVDAFKNRKFTGMVTTCRQLRRRFGQPKQQQREQQQLSRSRPRNLKCASASRKRKAFRPGMSVTAEIETHYRTNVLTVPLASVTTRPMKAESKDRPAETPAEPTPPPPPISAPTRSRAQTSVAGTNTGTAAAPTRAADKKSKEAIKQMEVVFVVEGDHVKTVPVKIGICDDNYWEITDGLTEGQEMVSGGFKAIRRDWRTARRSTTARPKQARRMKSRKELLGTSNAQHSTSNIQ